MKTAVTLFGEDEMYDKAVITYCSAFGIHHRIPLYLIIVGLGLNQREFYSNYKTQFSHVSKHPGA